MGCYCGIPVGLSMNAVAYKKWRLRDGEDILQHNGVNCTIINTGIIKPCHRKQRQEDEEDFGSNTVNKFSNQKWAGKKKKFWVTVKVDSFN